MKKVVLSLLAFGLVGAAAFAQDAPKVTISDWGRQVIATGNTDGANWTSVGASWGGAPRIVGLNIQAKTDTVGFSITPSADNGTFGLTDQNKAWVNPLPGLTVESGITLETDTWRGVMDFGSYNWLRAKYDHGDSITFGRLGNGGDYASDVNYNKDGVGAWFLVDHGSSAGGAAPQSWNNLGSHVQAGGAYTLPAIGQLKAQYIGYNVNAETSVSTHFGSQQATDPDHFGVVQVAFNLSAVKDLYEEVGVQVPTNSGNAGYTYQITDLVGYKVDKATLNGQVIAVGFTDDNGGKSGLGLGGGVGLDYDLGDSVGFTGDVRYQNALAVNAGAKDSGDAFVGLTLGITKGFSNGLIGIAFEYTTTGGYAFGSAPTDKGAWAIPVRLEESF